MNIYRYTRTYAARDHGASDPVESIFEAENNEAAIEKIEHDESSVSMGVVFDQKLERGSMIPVQQEEFKFSEIIPLLFTIEE